MIKLSKLSDYAVVVLSLLARDREKLMTAAGLSAASGIPEPTVAKVLKLLSKEGVITSTRGVNGGYMLERDPAEISVTELITALEGPIALTACVEGSDDECGIESICPMSGKWQKVNATIKNALDGLPLSDLLISVPSSRRTPGSFENTAQDSGLRRNDAEVI